MDVNNYDWAAEILTHLTRSDPGDMDARNLKSEALRSWTHHQTNIYWCNFGLSNAAQLDGLIDRSTPWNFADPAIVAVLPTNKILSTMSVRLNAQRAAGEKISVQFATTDTDETSGYTIRNKVAAFTDGPLMAADVTIRGSKAAILHTITPMIA